MRVKINSAVPFSENGKRLCGVVKEIVPVDDAFLLTVSVRGRIYTISSDQIVRVRPVEHKPLVTLSDLIGR